MYMSFKQKYMKNKQNIKKPLLLKLITIHLEMKFLTLKNKSKLKKFRQNIK